MENSQNIIKYKHFPHNLFTAYLKNEYKKTLKKVCFPKWKTHLSELYLIFKNCLTSKLQRHIAVFLRRITLVLVMSHLQSLNQLITGITRHNNLVNQPTLSRTIRI